MCKIIFYHFIYLIIFLTALLATLYVYLRALCLLNFVLPSKDNKFFNSMQNNWTSLEYTFCVCPAWAYSAPTRKLEKNLKNTNKFFKSRRMGHKFSRGWKFLIHRSNDPEVLVSRKVVWGDPYTEGSETTKSGTDEQERHMRHVYLGK